MTHPQMSKYRPQCLVQKQLLSSAQEEQEETAPVDAQDWLCRINGIECLKRIQLAQGGKISGSSLKLGAGHQPHLGSKNQDCQHMLKQYRGLSLSLMRDVTCHDGEGPETLGYTPPIDCLADSVKTHRYWYRYQSVITSTWFLLPMPLAAQCEIPPHMIIIAQYCFEIVSQRGVSQPFALFS